MEIKLPHGDIWHPVGPICQNGESRLMFGTGVPCMYAGDNWNWLRTKSEINFCFYVSLITDMILWLSFLLQVGCMLLHLACYQRKDALAQLYCDRESFHDRCCY